MPACPNSQNEQHEQPDGVRVQGLIWPYCAVGKLGPDHDCRDGENEQIVCFSVGQHPFHEMMDGGLHGKNKGDHHTNCGCEHEVAHGKCAKQGGRHQRHFSGQSGVVTSAFKISKGCEGCHAPKHHHQATLPGDMNSQGTEQCRERKCSTASSATRGTLALGPLPLQPEQQAQGEGCRDVQPGRFHEASPLHPSPRRASRQVPPGRSTDRCASPGAPDHAPPILPTARLSHGPGFCVFHCLVFRHPFRHHERSCDTTRNR